MVIPLGSAVRRVAAAASGLLIAAVLIPQALILWIADHRIESQTIDIMQRGVALTPGNGTGWDQVGRLKQFDFLNPDLPGAIRDFQKAVADDPRTAHFWIDLADAYQMAGDDAHAADAFARAKAAYPASAEVTFHYGNFLLLQQKYPEAFEQLRLAVRGDPTFLPLAISRTWRSTEDVDQLINDVLPPTADAYLQAIDFFSSSRQIDPALAVWRRLIALHQKVPVDRTFAFIDELIHEDRSEDVKHVWLDALAMAGLPQDEPSNGSLVWNGNFSRDFLNGGLDWRWTSVLGADFDYDAAPTSGSRAVRLDFNGGSNVQLTAPAEAVPVEPNTTYRFHALMRTEGITTESGVHFQIIDANHNGAPTALTEDLTGSHDWMPVEAELTTGPQTHFFIVFLQRQPSRLFDNKLGGTVWLTDVSLTPAAAATGASTK
jgi:tetratricopeptide (TPR) repeat protein